MQIQKRTRLDIMKEKISGRVLVPALLWVMGMPLGLVFLIWFFFFRGR